MITLDEKSLRRRRVAVSFLIALGIFLVSYAALFIAPNPERAWYNISENPGGILFMTSLIFVIYGVPLWGVLLVILSTVGPYRSGLAVEVEVEEGRPDEIPTGPPRG